MFDGFWENVSRYPRYFVTIVLGIFLNAISPLTPLFRHPTTAIAIVGMFVGLSLLVLFTLRAMLGISPT